MKSDSTSQKSENLRAVPLSPAVRPEPQRGKGQPSEPAQLSGREQPGVEKATLWRGVPHRPGYLGPPAGLARGPPARHGPGPGRSWLGGHPGRGHRRHPPDRGSVVQVAFAATRLTVALGEGPVFPAGPMSTDDRTPPRAARRSHRSGAVALGTGGMLGPPAGGAALNAGWVASVLTALAVACALASLAVHTSHAEPQRPWWRTGSAATGRSPGPVS